MLPRVVSKVTMGTEVASSNTALDHKTVVPYEALRASGQRRGVPNAALVTAALSVHAPATGSKNMKPEFCFQ